MGRPEAEHGLELEVESGGGRRQEDTKGRSWTQYGDMKKKGEGLGRVCKNGLMVFGKPNPSA